MAKIVGKIKGNGTKIDERIPATYLLRLILSKGISLVYGMIRLRTFKRVYIHPSAKIKCASRIQAKKNFVVGQDCYIDADRKSTRIQAKKNFVVGQDCYIDALSENGLICGENVSMGFHTHIELTGSLRFLGNGIKIGNNVGLGSHGHYGSGMGFVDIGDNTIFGNYVSVHPENHNFSDLSKPIRDQGVNSKGGVKIGNNCWIGAKVTILDGTVIGNGCIIAAGAVVKGIFPDNVIIGGIPAKVIKQR